MTKLQKPVTLYLDIDEYNKLRILYGCDPDKISKSFQHFLQCMIAAGVQATYGGDDK